MSGQSAVFFFPLPFSVCTIACAYPLLSLYTGLACPVRLPLLPLPVLARERPVTIPGPPPPLIEPLPLSYRGAACMLYVTLPAVAHEGPQQYPPLLLYCIVMFVGGHAGAGPPLLHRTTVTCQLLANVY